MKRRNDWSVIMAEALRIVGESEVPMTLRGVYYRLLPFLTANTLSNYHMLSSKISNARLKGTFPDLIDPGREIFRYQTWTSPEGALQEAVDCYRRDRTEGQELSIYIGIEKIGMVQQLAVWFADLGIPIIGLGGFSSTTYVLDVRRDIDRQDRPAILIYAGDFDPSGEAIERDFVEKVGCFDKVVRVALSEEQVDEYDLPEMPGKRGDSRAGAFEKRHGRLVQVEIDALDVTVLRQLYEDELKKYWDDDAYLAVRQREDDERDVLGEEDAMKVLRITDNEGGNYMLKVKRLTAKLRARGERHGVHQIDILHDDWCPMLNGGRLCTCDPEVKLRKVEP